MTGIFKIIISLLIVNLTFLTSYTYNIERISADKNICHIDDNRILFQEPINITSEAVWQNELCIMDLDNDNYPEIVSGLCEMKTEFGNYQDGLHSFEYNNGNFSHTYYDFNDSIGSVREINMKGDEYPDIIFAKSVLIGSSYHIMAYSIINDNGNLSLQNWSFIVVNNNSLSDFTIGDIDADGLYDFIANSAASSDFIHPGINTGNSSFVNDDWNNGLPSFDSKHPDSSHKYEASDEVLCDLNNDGWLDICSATGNSGAYRNFGPFQCYNYISDGKGNWSEFSENFPEYEWGRNLAVADIDNDGDLDVLLATTRNYDNWIPAKYLYENDDGKGWIQRPFPEEFEYFSSNHREVFDDLDQDGNMDLLMIQTIPTYDNHDKVNGYDSEVWIAFGNGDWTWDLVKQGTFFNGGQSYHSSLYDIDLDGDKDLIFSHSMTGTYKKGGLVWFPNTVKDKPILSFTEKPMSPHMRGGSIQNFEWTYTESDDPRLMKDEFDLSISYSGEDGPFFVLETGLKRWWKDLIIPIIPSREVHFRLTCGDHSAFCGPYTIHVDDFSNMIELENPSDGSVFYPNETIEMNMRSGGQFKGGSVKIFLNHEGGSIEVGEVKMETNGKFSYNYEVPDFGRDLRCRVEFKFDFAGKHISQFSGKEMILASDSYIPRSIEYDTFECRMEEFSPFPFFIESKGGYDITSLCSYDVIYNPYDFDLEIRNSSEFMIKPNKSGELNFTLIASKYGKYVSSKIVFFGYKPIEKIEINIPDREMIVGEEFVIEIRTYDENGTIWIPDENEYYLETNGSCRIIDVDLPKVRMMGTDSGILKFNFSLIRPMIYQNAQMEIFPYFVNMSITPERKFLFVNEEIRPSIRILDHTYTESSNFSIDLDLDGPCNKIGEYPDIMIIPTGSGEISITATAIRLEEELTLKKVYIVIREVGNPKFNDSIERIELGSNKKVSMELQDIDNMFTIEDYCIADIIHSKNLQIKWDHNKNLSIWGIHSGKGSIEIKLDLYGHQWEYYHEVEVVNLPRNVNLNLPDILTFGKNFKCEIEVMNSMNMVIGGYEVFINSSKLQILLNDNSMSVTGIELGKGWLEINVSCNGGHYIYYKDFDVIFNPVLIILEKEEYIGYRGQWVVIHPMISDDEGNLADWYDWIIDCDSSMETNQVNETLFFRSEMVGSYSIKVKMNHEGIELKKDISVKIRESSKISRVEIWHTKENVVEVRILDQYGENITHLCDIVWNGQFQRISDFKVISRTDVIIAKVFLNGTEKEIKYHIGSNGQKGNKNIFILIAIVIILVIITILSVYFFSYWKKKGKKNQREEKPKEI